MMHVRNVLVTLLFALLLPVMAAAKLEPANLTLNTYQRIFPAAKTINISLTTFNLRRVTFTVYPVSIEALIPNTAVLNAANDSPKNPDSVRGRLQRMPLGRAVRTWSVDIKDYYPDDWRYRAVKTPALPPGVYVIQGSGGGVTQRTWFAVSSRALVTKRSPDVVKAWLVSTDGRRAIAGVPLALYNAGGRVQTVTTGADGIATFAAPNSRESLWIAAQRGEPAFARAGQPEEEKPYRVYLYTDRPVYRPGQSVYFKGTVRAVTRGAYRLPAEKTVRVQIKTRGDTVVHDETLPLNAWGSFAGDFQLAPEPPLGHYSLEVSLPGDYREYTSFEVESYRKPDFEVKVTMPAEHVLNGKPVPVKIAANYFFGSPVSRGTVKYAVSFAGTGNGVPTRIFTAAGLGSGAAGVIEDNFDGQGRLDANGMFELSIPTRYLSFDREVRVRAAVTDLSLRSRSAEGHMLLQSARFRMNINAPRYQYQPGATVPITVTTCDYNGKPVSAKVNMVMIEQRSDREGRIVEERTTQAVTTGKDGKATATFTVVRPGGYRVEAWALDDERRLVFTQLELYVTTEKPAPQWPTLDMNLTKNEYAPGDTARLRVQTSMIGSVALLTLEGERLYLARLVKLQQKDMLIDMPVLADYQPGVAVRLTVIQDGNMRVGYADLNVPVAGKRLTITLTPNKVGYQPGETATYTVTTKDAGGKGVPAEVGLGVVDTALYAIREDNVGNPHDFFWSWQNSRVDTDFSLSATYPGGAYQRLPMPPPPPPPAKKRAEDVRVRKQFEDTAFWTASVVTDANGVGTVTFTLPDNLTTWRTTARGLTKSTQAGMKRDEVVVTQPLMARLVLPRFYTRGDNTTAAALVHNYTDENRRVRVTLTADGVQVAGDAEQTVNLPANGIARVIWTVTATGKTGDADDSATFLVSADGGAGARDAMEATVPVHPDGVRRVDAVAGVATESVRVALNLPHNAVPGSAQMELTLSPSLAGPIFEALDYLVQYPYGCAEQTMDRFLPDVIVARTLKELGVNRPTPMLKRYVNFGVQKLLRYQHDDGGWHWWENDDSDPYMTAYVVYGLAMARDAGYPLAAGPLPRGTAYLEEFLANYDNAVDRPAAAYLLWALVSSAEWSDELRETAVPISKDLYRHRETLDTFSKASLSLALHRMSTKNGVPADFAAMARKVAQELEAGAVATGATVVHWTANAAASGSWLDSNVEVTAQVLQTLLAITPKSEKIVPAVRWLMAARRGKQWSSTKDTAAAVLALSAYLKDVHELAPDYTVTVRSGGEAIQRVIFTPAQAFSDPVRIIIPAAKLAAGDNVLTLDKDGDGTLYWTAHLSYVLPVDGLEPLSRGVAIARQYRVVAESPVDAGTQKVGETVQVTLTLTADQPLRYAMLSEPIPAGCEVVTGDEQGCDRRDVWDNRIVYFFDYLRTGETTVSYWLRTEAPGLYRVPPASAELLYFPEVRGESRTARMKVVDE